MLQWRGGEATNGGTNSSSGQTEWLVEGGGREVGKHLGLVQQLSLAVIELAGKLQMHGPRGVTGWQMDAS